MLRWFSQDVEKTAPGSRKGCDTRILFVILYQNN